MPNINELNLSPEPVGEIDYNAPEQGSAFPPELEPGIFNFRFKLEEDPYDEQKVDGKPYLQVNFQAETEVDGNPVLLRFQRASFYKTEKMSNSFAGELIRSLGIKIEGPLTAQAIDSAFREAEAQGKVFRGEVNWRFYCKKDDLTVATNPRKKKGDVPWPRKEDKTLEAMVKCPKCGVKSYGRAEVTGFKLPEGDALGDSAGTAAATSGVKF